MKKEIIQVDNDRGIVRITTLDERWYSRTVPNKVTGLPEIETRSSITFIAHNYPKGKGFEQYLKRNGEDADTIVQLAAERGSKVHQAIEVLNRGGEVRFGDKFTNTRTGQEEELTPDEYWCVMTYQRWWQEEGSKEYEILAAEDIIWPEVPKTPENGDVHSEEDGILRFAATRDIRLRRKADGSTGTVDVKTSKDIYPAHVIQVSAIAEASSDAWQAILQVGYARTQKGYKFTEVPRKLHLLRAAMTIHAEETEGQKPLQRDYPLSISLDLPKQVFGFAVKEDPSMPPNTFRLERPSGVPEEPKAEQVVEPVRKKKKAA